MQPYLTQLDTAAKSFAQVLAHGDLAAPVSACPAWTLAELGDHLGGIHQWARHAVVAGTGDGEPTPAPPDRDGLVQWYQDSAGALLSTLRGTDPATPVWAFGPKPRVAAFWHRRQAHETTIHLWDAESSQGAAAPIDKELAGDGIDELLTVFFPRQVRLNRIPALESSLAISAADLDERWVLAGDGLGPTSARDASADATVTGPAEALYLLLWHRIGLDDPRLRVDGDEQAALSVLNSDLTP
jgi:uncharacterized protein (TIGR03083 family)